MLLLELATLFSGFDNHGDLIFYYKTTMNSQFLPKPLKFWGNPYSPGLPKKAPSPRAAFLGIRTMVLHFGIFCMVLIYFSLFFLQILKHFFIFQGFIFHFII